VATTGVVDLGIMDALNVFSCFSTF